jgi:colanic acid/amylovoran biosynthesis glycosyltransferase
MKVAYIVSRFPKLTETFVLNELFAVEKQGVQVELYPLQREPAGAMHPGAETWVKRAHYTPWLSPAILWSNLVEFLRQPRAYLRTLVRLLWSTRTSRRFFAGALAFFPKSVHLARLMRRHGIQHIHAHFASHPAASAFIIHRLTGIPYSFTAHGSDIHRDQSMLKEKTGEAAFVVPISRFNRTVILQASNGKYMDKMHIVHCGVDTQRFQRAASDRQDQAQAKKHTPFDLRIACVGTLHEVKGQTYLLEACRILKEKGLPFTCHFIGDGPDQAALSKQAQAAGLNGRVIFHGRLDQQSVLNQLRQSDVLVAPSVPSKDGRREGIPVVLMEAMACGLPVISSRISGIPELVEDGISGILTEPGNAAAIAEALEHLAANPTIRHSLGQCGRERVVEAFDLHDNAAKLARLFATHGEN